MPELYHDKPFPYANTTANQASEVACPRCQAAAGARCKSQDGEKVGYHVERARIARYAALGVTRAEG